MVLYNPKRIKLSFSLYFKNLSSLILFIYFKELIIKNNLFNLKFIHENINIIICFIVMKMFRINIHYKCLFHEIMEYKNFLKIIIT